MTTIESCYQRIEQNLNVKLIHPHQPDGCRWMLEKELSPVTYNEQQMPCGGVLADEVGLGKTILSICMMIGNVKPRTLVILPKSLVLQWKEQIEKFSSSLQVFILMKSTDRVVTHSGLPVVYLMSHSLLNIRNRVVGTSEVHNYVWDRIIIDEAHMLRNRKSKLFESSMLLRSTIKWALTATPVMNRMSDFVHLMEWIGVSRILCQQEKNDMTAMFILRRTKEDISAKSTPCHIQVKYIPFSSDEEAHLYCKVFHKERNMIKKNTNTNVPDLLEHLLRVRQVCIHPQLYMNGMSMKKKTECEHWNAPVTKIVELLKCVHSQPDDDKAIIFCQFVKEMDAYEKVFMDEGRVCSRIDGTMSISERQKNIDYFTHDPEVKLFLIQINTGGQGINLQMANHIYIMSPNWNPAIEYQAIGRAHRTGQKKSVFVTKFCITSGDESHPFVEENIIKLQEKKKKIIADILNDDRIQNDGVDHVRDMTCGLSSKDIFRIFNIYREE
jgi:SNF2 family DNA or RNA helicase